jgi:putative flippase GtrA
MLAIASGRHPAPSLVRMPLVDTATALLDKLTRGNADKLVKFSAASIVGVVVTQSLLVLLHGVMNENAVLANVLAVVISAVPVFILNKRWVWGHSGPADVRREIVPFWLF